MDKSLALPDMVEVTSVATAMVKSGYFQDAKDASQAIVKILAGREIGIGPFASMNGVNIIKGKASFNANIQAAAVKSSGRYDYRVVTLSDQVCELAFFEGKQELGRSVFTSEDAKRAGTQNMNAYPRNMLFARAMSNGVKWFCPDIFNGATVYTPEELGASTDEEGNVIEIPAASELKPTPTPAPATVAKPAAAAPHIKNNPVPITPASNTPGPESVAMLDVEKLGNELWPFGKWDQSKKALFDKFNNDPDKIYAQLELRKKDIEDPAKFAAHAEKAWPAVAWLIAPLRAALGTAWNTMDALRGIAKACDVNSKQANLSQQALVDVAMTECPEAAIPANFR